jgi:hypothetical protein
MPMDVVTTMAAWLIAGAALVHIVTGTQNAWDLLLGVTVKTDRSFRAACSPG